MKGQVCSDVDFERDADRQLENYWKNLEAVYVGLLPGEDSLDLLKDTIAKMVADKRFNDVDMHFATLILGGDRRVLPNLRMAIFQGLSAQEHASRQCWREVRSALEIGEGYVRFLVERLATAKKEHVDEGSHSEQVRGKRLQFLKEALLEQLQDTDWSQWPRPRNTQQMLARIYPAWSDLAEVEGIVAPSLSGLRAAIGRWSGSDVGFSIRFLQCKQDLIDETDASDRQ